jgi:hypothetical protein
MFPILKKRREYLKQSLKDKGGPVGDAPNDEGDGDHAALAEHHKKLAEHHHALAEEHGKFATVPAVEDTPQNAEQESSPYTSDNEEGPNAIMFGDSSEKPPDTVETAKYGPVESEEEETPAHEAGESKEVEAIEESRKPALGLSWEEGHSLRNSDEEHKPLSRGGRSFRPFKKGGSFKP